MERNVTTYEDYLQLQQQRVKELKEYWEGKRDSYTETATEFDIKPTI